MKAFDWSEEKNAVLLKARGICFERIVFHILSGDLLDLIEHPIPGRYPGQRVFIVKVDNYCWAVPFVEDERTIFLKTAMPSRRYTQHYLGGRPK